jgi:LPXTG-motif cell wall-anchored protein
MVLNFVTPLKALAEGTSDSVTIDLLATSDLHGKFYAWDYATNKEDKSGSMTQLMTILKNLRAANPNSILVDAGDTIQGNSSQLFNNDPIHPMILGMNEMGYDTWSLGNHEFNYGVDTLKRIMNESISATPLVANVYESNGTTRLNNNPGYKIVERPGLNGENVKVAIIGLVTPNILRWDAANLLGYVVTNPVDEAKRLIPEIKTQTDIIVAVVHMSENNEYDVAGSGSNDLADGVPELTAIVAAHEHKAMDQTFRNNILTTENKNGAATLSRMQIKVVKKDGKYVVANKATDVSAKLIYVQDPSTKAINYQPDSELSAKLEPFHLRAKADAETVIGTLTGGDLVPASEVKGIPTAQIQDTPMIDLINKVQLNYAVGTRVAASAMFTSSANIKEGIIQKSGATLIYPYDNTLYKLQMNGKQLKQYMEWSANYYNQYKAGDLTISFNPAVRAYNYDMFTGVDYTVDISQPEGSRIKDLVWSDTKQPVNDNDSFEIAVNNYRANSHLLKAGEVYKAGDSLPTLIESDVRGGVGVRDLIGEYIKTVKSGTITPEVDNNWKVMGNNWDAKQRALAVKLINSDKIKLPTSADGRTPNVASITYAMALEANKVSVVSFNDFHGALKEGSSSSKDIGAAKLSAAINAERKANPDTILLSAGDLYQGSAMSNLKYGKPVSDVIKAIGIEASAVGNHEFDWGVDYISEWAKDGNLDFLASNVYSRTTGKPVTWAKPYEVVIKDGLKIGLIGIATPETAVKTKPENVKNLEFKDPVEAANEWASYLRNIEKVDVVIALTHLGSFQDSKTKVITGEVVDFANRVKGVNAVITAHTHQTVAGVVNNIPVVQGYYNGRALAKLNIYRDENGSITKITPSVDELYLRVKTLAVDPVVKAIVDKYDTELKPILDEVLGATDKDLPHDKNASGVSLLGQWTSDVMKAKAGTEIAITNGGGLRTSIAKGQITMGNMYSVMPFDNTLVKMELKGSDIKKNIENGIGNESIGWVQFTGMKVHYDLSKPFGSRIVGIYLMDGSKMDMDKYYTVVTNDFMATGGDSYNFASGKNIVDTGIPIREALVEALRKLTAEGKVLSVTPDDYLVSVTAVANETAKVVEALKATGNKSTVIVDISNITKVSLDIFEAVKGQDKNVNFVMNGVSFTFNGLSIKPELIKEIDLSLKTVSPELKAKEIAKIKAVVGKEVAIAPFSFNYDGYLPGEASIKLLIGKDWANKEVYINRYFADKNTYEIIQTSKVDSEGYVEFKLNHFSDYFVMDKTVAPSLPKTGAAVDTNVMVSVGLLVSLLGAAMLATRRKREELEA